uniref:Uncharacterized protein n=1 Tax=Anguilla anguilla TaxID=7936 RepID=A0A0E9RAR5_ANGAN
MADTYQAQPSRQQEYSQHLSDPVCP